MNDLQIFNSKEFGQVRTIEKEGKTYFVGIDVAKNLGYKNPTDAITRHCKGCVKYAVGVTTGKKANGEDATQNVIMKFITEGDIYRLTAKSELEGAEKFESWIFDKVSYKINKKTGQVEVIKEEQK